MAIATWPAALHFQPEMDSLQMQLNSGVIRTPMDGANTIHRVVFWNTPIRQQFTWLFQGAEWTIFHGFWYSDLTKGTRSFRAPIWDGSTYTVLTCKFVEDPVPSSSGVSDMKVEATIEIRGMVALDSGASWFVSFYGPDFTVSFSDQLHHIVNVQMPEALVNQGAT